MKKLGYIGVAFATLLLSACGGSGSSDSIASKKIVIIFTYAQAGVCETSTFRDLLAQEGYQDFTTRETSVSTNCATYGKTYKRDCDYITGHAGNVNCVVGVNSIRQGKLIGDVSMYDTFEILESELQ